jgi:hypothetical protein
VGPRGIWGSSLHYHASRRHNLVRHQRSTQLLRFVARIQTGRHRRASTNEPDSSTDSSDRWLPPASAVDGSRWYPSFWCHLRRVILHLLRPLDHDERCGLCTDDLLPALRRELPLAVEEFLYGWSKRFLRLRICTDLLGPRRELLELDQWCCISGIQRTHQCTRLCLDR